jgi:hypothetical protein
MNNNSTQMTQIKQINADFEISRFARNDGETREKEKVFGGAAAKHPPLSHVPSHAERSEASKKICENPSNLRYLRAKNSCKFV